MSLKLVLVLRSSPHEVCFHFMADGFEHDFFHHVEETLGAEAAARHNQEERLMFIFAPLAFTNSKAMEEAPEFFCRSLELDDDYAVLCEAVDDFHLFAVFHSPRHSSTHLARQFSTVKDLFLAVLGPCWNFLIPSRNRTVHDALQSLLRAMVAELLFLQSTEFQLQFGACEHLSVQKEHKITGVTALEQAVAKLGRRLRGQAGPVRHALLLAGTKLFALYSGAGSELSAGALLLVSLLVRTLFQRPHDDPTLEDFLTAASDSQDEFFSPSEELSCNPDATLVASMQSTTIEAETLLTDQDLSSPSDTDSMFTPPDPSATTRMHPVVQEVATGERMARRMDYRFARLLLDEDGVFSLHLVRISRQLVVVFFQESPEMALSVKMSRAVSLTRSCRQRRDGPLRTLPRLLTDISTRLVELFGADVREARLLLDQRDRLQESLDPSALNDALDTLHAALADTFAKLFLRFPWPVAQETSDVVASAARLLQTRLRDYVDYLEVKAVRNLAPTSFKCSLPGMLHFVWVDRERNRLVSPTLDPEEVSPELAARIRHRAEYCRELHQQTNHKEVYCKDAYLQYSYRVLSKSPRRRIPSDGKEFRQGAAHELLVVHLAHVSRDTVKLHVRRMLDNFLRQTDDVNASLGLLA